MLQFFLKKLTFLFIFFVVTHCYLHHANITGDIYGLTTVIDFQSGLKGQLPIRLEFDPRQKEKIRDYLRRKGQNIEISQDLIETYYSEEIISKFKNNKYFVHSPDANIKIKINPSIEEVRAPLFSLIANIGTLGFFPAITRTYGRMEFNLFDTEQNKIIKTYKYGIEHRHLFSWTSAVLGAVLPSFSERFDHSQNERSYTVMRVVFNQFNIDLVNDLGKNKELVSRFTSKPIYYALYLDPKIVQAESQIENLLLSNLETAFVDRKLNLVERKKIKRIIEEIKLSQYGLTDSKRLEFGQLLSAENLIEVSNVSLETHSMRTKFLFSIRCVSVESGKILWSETVLTEHSKSDSEEKIVQLGLDKLIRELELKGVF